MNKTWRIILIVVLALLAIRFALPFLLVDLANKRLERLDGYEGKVKDVDLALYRGAYMIDSVEIVKTGDSLPVPFISVPKVELSLQWKALKQGKFFGMSKLTKPVINFALAYESNPAGNDSSRLKKIKQFGKGVKWMKKIKKFSPLEINHVEIINGTIAYSDFTSDPQVDVKIDSLHIVIKNMKNLEKASEALPASLEASGIALNGGSFKLEANMNMLADPPDVDMEMQIEKINMKEMNNLLRAYTNTDVETGTFNVFTEMKVNDGEIKGYVKPVMENLKLVKWKQEDEPVTDKVWESIVGGIIELFENQSTERVATTAPLRGNLKDIEAETVPALWNILHNAFADAYNKSLKQSIDWEEKN